MQCPRCRNTDPEYFYKGSSGWYCRRCVMFQRAMIEEEENEAELAEVQQGSEEYTLQYPLTPKQKEISEQCAAAMRTKDVLLHCVCGAGKTELVIRSIAEMLKEGKKVGFAIPRRRVVLELQERLAGYFPKAKVTAVCGGHTEETDGDLIICTTHQLFRYTNAFDLLILDEPDAFPYRGSDVLHGIASTACRGHRIYLTATPDEEMKARIADGTLEHLTLYERPHGKPLPVPEIWVRSRIPAFFALLKWLFGHADAPRMVFVPTVRGTEIMAFLLSLFLPCMSCTSRTPERDAVMEEFRNSKDSVLCCTSLAERGLTVTGVQIAVWQADSPVYDEAALIQMAGRAGRRIEEPEGDVLFLCLEHSDLAQACQKEIMEANAHAVPSV